ncbi:hypothetical protein SZ55_0097 [Pseudomonas sp. FeS53a]|nr:hypothetical protein SZ55_0097 [Pseudomonas sp. FeS53a]
MHGKHGRAPCGRRAAGRPTAAPVGGNLLVPSLGRRQSSN